jgi:hypothetical protein
LCPGGHEAHRRGKVEPALVESLSATNEALPTQTRVQRTPAAGAGPPAPDGSAMLAP